MSGHPLNVLFPCAGNSARSILAAVAMNEAGAGRCRAYRAGSHPDGRVTPFALALLAGHGLPTDGLRSKRRDVSAVPDAPPLDRLAPTSRLRAIGRPGTAAAAK